MSTVPSQPSAAQTEQKALLDSLWEQYQKDKSRSHLEAMFRAIDTDNDGAITKQELISAMQIDAGDQAEMAAGMMLLLGDKNNDSLLSMAEFVELNTKAGGSH